MRAIAWDIVLTELAELSKYPRKVEVRLDRVLMPKSKKKSVL